MTEPTGLASIIREFGGARGIVLVLTSLGSCAGGTTLDRISPNPALAIVAQLATERAERQERGLEALRRACLEERGFIHFGARTP